MNILQGTRKVFMFEGILMLILGLLAVAFPVIFTVGIELFIGWLFLIGGAVQAYRAFKAHREKGFALSLITAAIYIAFGLILILYPIAGILSLTILLTFFFVLEGIFKIAFAFNLRPMPNWGWLLFSGIISLLLAFIIWSGWPQTAFWVIGLLVGINLIFYGISLIFLANAFPKPPTTDQKS